MAEATHPVGNPLNVFVAAVSVGLGMLPLVAPTFFGAMPDVLHPLLESGILLAPVVSVLLNVFCNSIASSDDAAAPAAVTAAAADHA